MSVTKTYSYTYLGVPSTIDVTIDVLTCEIEAVEGSAGDLDGRLTITASIPSALAFGLNVFFDVEVDFLSGSGSSLTSYQTQLTIPAGLTSHSFENVLCYSEQMEPFQRSSYAWAFADQPFSQDEGTPLSATASVTETSCFGQANGQIIINPIGGSGGYTYSWVGSASVSNIRNGLAGGLYTVTVTDSEENTFTLTDIEVGQPDQITIDSTITPVSCHGGNNGAVSVSATAGVAPFSYSWSDGSTSQNRTSLLAGNYTLTVVDADGCNRSFLIIVPQPLRITITVNQEGNDVENVITGGTAPFTYLWSDGFITKDRNDLPVGTYTFTVTDANGCIQSAIIIIQDFKFYFSKNPIWLSLQAADPETKDNLSFVCEVFLESDYDSDDFVKIYESEQPARADGSTDFNMEQVLNSFLDANVPAFGDNISRQVNESFKRFYLRYFEKYGTPPEPDTTIDQETFFVLFGGLSEQEFAKGVFFDNYLDTQKPFLTWAPLEIAVSASQDAYLHYVVVSELFASLTLRCVVNYTDNTSVSSDILTVSATKPFEVYRFPAGVGQLAIALLNPAKTIKSYTLQLFTGVDAVSEIRTYIVVPERRHFKKLLYLNSVGGWDALLCTGRGKESIRTMVETINRELPVAFEYQDREEQTVNKTGNISRDVVIGNLNGYQRRHLIDLAISESVYEQTASGYLPVQVKFDFDPQDDFENLDEISLSIIYPKVRRYTPEL